MSQSPETNPEIPDSQDIVTSEGRPMSCDKHKRYELVGSGPNYDGAGIRTSLHGVAYQINLLMLFLKRALKEKYVFSLATEVDAADKFDDLVFKYEKNNMNTYRFLQAKHRQDDSKKVTEVDILDEKGGHFSVQKYFFSYLTIKNAKRKFFKGDYEDFIICTNSDIDSSLESGFYHLTKKDPLLWFDPEKCASLPKRLKLVKGTELYQKLETVLQKNPDHPQIAQKLGEKAAKSNVIVIDTLLTDNRDWILQNIFDEKTMKMKVNKYYLKLKDNFLNPNDEDMKNFSVTFLEAFMEERKRQEETSETENMISMETIKQELREMEFQLAKNFVKSKAKLKNNDSTKEEISSFLDKFVFAVNQPNEEELKNIVEVEIGDFMGLVDGELVASKLQTCILDWAKKRHGRFITSQDCLDLFMDVEYQIASLGQLSLTITRKKLLDNFKCVFESKNEKLQDMERFLKRERKSQILIVYYNYRILTEIKLMQLSDNVKIDEFLILDMENLFGQLNTKVCPIKAFSSRACIRLFLTINDNSELNSEGKVILANFFDIISKNAEKQIILLVPLKSRDIFEEFSESLLENHKYIQMRDTSLKFIDLTAMTQMNLLHNAKVKVHGCLVTLGNLLNEEDKHRMSGDVLSTLICGELQLQGEIPDKKYDEVKEFCIDRTLQRRIILSKDIMSDHHFHIITNYKELDPTTNQDVLLIASQRNDFVEICNLHEHVHWIREENCELVWQESTGSITRLRQYFFTAESVTNLDSKHYKTVIDTEYDNLPLYTNIKSNEDKTVYPTEIGGENRFFNPRTRAIPCNCCCADDEGFPLYRAVSKPKKSNDINNKIDLNSVCRLCVYHYMEAGKSGDQENDINLDGNYKIKNVSDLNERIVIVSAEPGMGKSTLLSQLLVQSVDNNKDNIYVIKVDLRDYSQDFFTQPKREITLEEAITFIFKISKLLGIDGKRELKHDKLFSIDCNEELSLNNDSESVIDTIHLLKIRSLTYLYNQYKINVLFDGFDEVVPHYTEQCMALLEALKRTRLNKIWITTRPYNIETNLENKLNTISYKLKPLSVPEQNYFLINFWERKLNIQIKVKELEDFLVSCLPRSFWKITEGEHNNLNPSVFMGIPLHVLMLATIYENDFYKFYLNITGVNKEKVTNVELSLFDLYSLFFKLKFENLYAEINLKDPRFVKDYEKKCENELLTHRKLGLLEFFEDAEIPESLLENVQEDMKRNLFESVSTGDMKLGLVECLGEDGRPRFVHRTYTEYFAADFLADALLSKATNEQKYNAAKDFLYRFLTNFKRAGNNIFTFLNYKIISISEQSAVFNAVMNLETHPMKKLRLIKQHNDLKDILGRSLVHLTYYSNNNNHFISKYCPRWVSSHLFKKDDLFNWTPLHYAIAFHKCNYISGYFHYVIGDKSSITSNDDKDLQDMYGVTPYILSAKHGCSGRCIKVFLQEIPMNVDVQDKTGNTALHHALNNNNAGAETFVIRMLSKEANMFIPNEEGKNVFEIINFQKTKDLENKTFQSHYLTCIYFEKMFVQSPEKMIKMFHECYFSNPDALVFFLSSWNLKCFKSFVFETVKMDVNMRDREGKTALHKAFQRIQRDGPDAFLYLLEMNADFNIRDNAGLLPTHFDYDCAMQNLVRGYSPKIFSLLNKCVASSPILTTPFVLKMELDTDITVQILSRFENIAEILISNGTDVDTRDSSGKTALHFAVMWKRPRNVSFLLSKGANIVLEDADGKYPLKYLTEDTNLDRLNILRTTLLKFGTYFEWGPVPFSEKDISFINRIYGVLRNDDRNELETMFGNINDVQRIINVRMKVGGLSPLHFATIQERKEAIVYILSHGAVYNIPEENNILPYETTSNQEIREIFTIIENLEEAIKDNNEEKVLECVKKGVIIDAGVKYNDAKKGLKIVNLLHLAIQSDNAKIIEILLKNGAKCHMQTSDAETVLHIACQHGEEVMKVLLNFLSLEDLYNMFLHENVRYDIPLVVAFKQGNVETLKVLLDKCTFYENRDKFDLEVIFDRVTYVLTEIHTDNKDKISILEDYFAELFN